jgi:hypothetical protein
MLRILKARSAEHLRLVSDLFQEYGTIPGIEACPAGSGREAGALLMERELP